MSFMLIFSFSQPDTSCHLFFFFFFFTLGLKRFERGNIVQRIGKFGNQVNKWAKLFFALASLKFVTS